MTAEEAASFRAALMGFKKTALALNEDESRLLGKTCDTKFLFPLGDVLDALPRKYVIESALSSADRSRSVEIIVDNLLEQLGKGEVRISASRLVYGVPAGMIHSDAFRDNITMISLSLQAVVAALDPRLLAQSTARTSIVYKMDDLPDPFDLPSKDGAQVAAPTDSPQAPTESEAAEEEVEESGEVISEWLGGVNLNVASTEQLLQLNGVTPRTASAIVAHRQANGPFRSIFSLHRVPGVGRKTFKKITGMPYSRTGHHRRQVLAKLLGLPSRSVAHLPTVVEAVAAVPGFVGCLISDKDGLTLAESGVGERSAALAAIVPRMLKQLTENMHDIGGRVLHSFSACVDGRMVTVLSGGRVYLTALHEANRLTAKHLRLLQKTAGELQWLLSERGYVSAPSEGESA